MLSSITGEKVSYRGGIINLETGPVQLKIKGRPIKISFNILPLGQDEAVLGIPQLQEYNPKINWIIGKVEIYDI